MPPAELRPTGPSLWIVNHYAEPPDRASGTRHFDLARRLVADGFAVTIIAAGVSHLTGREDRLRGRELSRSEVIEGVRFVWLRTVPYRGNTWRRSLNMLSFAVVLVVAQARLRAPDAIIGSTVHPFAALSAWLVARLRRSRFLYEIRDLWPQTLVDMGAMRMGSPGERLLRAIEAFLVRRASAVIALLPGIRDYLRERGLPSEHVVDLPNGVDLAAFDRPAADDPARDPALAAALAAVDRRHREGRLVIGYVGALGRVNDVPTIVRAAALAEAAAPGRVAVLLVGDGPERPDVERAIAERTAPVDLLAPIAKRQIPDLLRAIDAAVIHATASATYRYGISFNKLFEAFAAARPVLFACESAYDPVARDGAGISLPPADPERLAEAMLRLAGLDDERRRQMGRAGRASVERDHDIAVLAARLAGVVREAERADSAVPGAGRGR